MNNVARLVIRLSFVKGEPRSLFPSNLLRHWFGNK